MSQQIENNSPITIQANVANNNGNIYFNKPTRWAKKFQKLSQEIASDERFGQILDDLKYYRTKLDGIDMPTKLTDGGFNEQAIIKAKRQKEKYAKKAEKFKFFESAQWIDSQLFALLKDRFETYLVPHINNGDSHDIIMRTLSEEVIHPVLDKLDTEGEDDEYLNYDVEDLYGMVYFLTGQCHLNWKDYGDI